MRKKPSNLQSLLFLFAVGVAVIALIFLGTDSLCRYDISRRLPPYPNAQLISSKTDSFRLMALGETELVYQTSDSTDDVAEWYRQLNLEQLKKGIFRGLANVNRYHEANPEGGTRIYYQSSCGI